MRSISIVAAFDSGYVIPFLGLARSLGATRKKGVDVHVTGLADVEDASVLSWIEQQLSGAGVGLTLIRVSSRELCAELAMEAHLTRAAYLRLFLARFLPPALRRAIYLDCDLIVRRCVSELFDMNLLGRVIGAVRDFSHFDRNALLPPESSSGPVKESPYFNSGVMVIDLERWRQSDVERRALAYARAHSVRFCDQDPLNAVLRGEWRELPPRWNVQLEALRPTLARVRRSLTTRSIVSVLSRPAITHFTDWKKPWGREYDCQSGPDFLRWLKPDELKIVGLLTPTESAGHVIARSRASEFRHFARQFRDAIVEMVFAGANLVLYLVRNANDQRKRRVRTT